MVTILEWNVSVLEKKYMIVGCLLNLIKQVIKTQYIQTQWKYNMNMLVPDLINLFLDQYDYFYINI